MEFSKEEKRRYSRQIVLPDFGEALQWRLKKASVLVVGAGGLGCPCLLYLNAAGVGIIGIMDDDRVSSSNLQRQSLFGEADVGKPKCEVAKEKLCAQNSNVEIQTYNQRLTKENVLQILQKYDVVIDGTDNFETGYVLNDACVLLNKPLVYASIFQYEGQLSVFNHNGGPTLRCLFPEMSEDTDNCSISGVFSPLAGLMGVWQASEALKVITGHGQTFSGKLLIFNILTNTTTILSFEENTANKNPNVLRANLLPETEILEIDAETFRKLNNDKVLQIIDVRNEDEFQAFNIGGKNIPLSRLDFDITGVDSHQKTVVLCQSGVRSAIALKTIKQHYPNIVVSHLRGGINAYRELYE